MTLSLLKKEDIQNYLDQINLVAYSNSFAEFVRLAYDSQRSFVGIFEGETLKVFFPVFHRAYRGQTTAEVPIFIYTEIFFIDKNYTLDADELGIELLRFAMADVLRMNLVLFFNDHAKITHHGFEHVFMAMIADLKRAADYNGYLKMVLSKNARSKIYKAYQGGLELVWLSSQDLSQFHQLYSEHVVSMGSKPHPPEYFKKMLEAYTPGKDLFMMGAKKDGRLVTANLFVTNKDYMEVRFLADELDSRHLFHNNFLYAEMIKWAYQHGIRWIDFGGIPKTMQSNIDFKKSLGAEEYPIYTKYFFSNPWQKLVFKTGRKWLYWKKYRKVILKRMLNL